MNPKMTIAERLQTLTPEQRAAADRMVAENEGLARWGIYEYGWMNPDIPGEELYSMYLEQIWIAAMTHDPKIATFGTYACMKLKYYSMKLRDRPQKPAGIRFAPHGYQCLSLDVTFGPEDAPLADSIPAPDPIEQIHEDHENTSIRALLREHMNDREMDMLDRRFAGWTLQEIGEEHGITRERVRQLLRRGISRAAEAA